MRNNSIHNLLLTRKKLVWWIRIRFKVKGVEFEFDSFRSIL